MTSMNEGMEKQKQQTVSVDIINYVSMLSEKSQIIVETLNNKLLPVMVKSIPIPEKGKEKEKEEREYPPLFSEIKNHLSIIEQSFNNIEDDLYRTEL